MLLSLMTYARLDVYRSSQTFQFLFNKQMEKEERGYINSVALKKYKTTKGSSKKSAENSKPAAPKVAASPRINISALLPSKKEDELYAQKQQQTATLFKNLMVVLYANQPFFQKIQRERPTFMDDIVREVIQEAAQLPEKQQIKSARDLANLKLSDPDLNEAFYKMLHGAPNKELLNQEEGQNITQDQDNGDAVVEDDKSDQAMMAKEAEEYKSPKGYFSLLDFVTIGSDNKIRVYLAPKEVLKAIYHNHVVDEIMRERQELYRQAVADEDGSNKESLKETFRGMFDRHKDALIDDNLLDYSVSKTKPPG
jgi:hypothetical protein